MYNSGMEIPSDDFILLSVIDMRMRDGGGLDEECASLGRDREEIVKRLKVIGYRYDKDNNAFK